MPPIGFIWERPLSGQWVVALGGGVASGRRRKTLAEAKIEAGAAHSGIAQRLPGRVNWAVGQMLDGTADGSRKRR
jgi:hypothetical protein